MEELTVSRILQRGVCELPWEQLCRVSRKNGVEKPEQTSITFPQASKPSPLTWISELHIYLSSHLQRRPACLLALSNLFWRILNHSRSQDFTQVCHICWHKQRNETPPVSTCQCLNCRIDRGTKRLPKSAADKG